MQPGKWQASEASPQGDEQSKQHGVILQAIYHPKKRLWLAHSPLSGILLYYHFFWFALMLLSLY
jgi:hypothetical protein